jgi:hypothetical protein
VPTQYVIDTDNRIVRVTFSGVVTCHEVADCVARLRDDPAFSQDFSELVTVGQNPDIRLGYLDWQSLADRDPFSSTSRHAFVVSVRSVVFGVIRMCQIARNDPGNIRIFEKEDEALAWISTPASLAQAEGR